VDVWGVYHLCVLVCWGFLWSTSHERKRREQKVLCLVVEERKEKERERVMV
jgi:hypothetical protein